MQMSYLNATLPWDGSVLQLTAPVIVNRWDFESAKYLEVHAVEGKLAAQFSRYQDALPLILDSIKPFFGVTPTGYHILKLSKGAYLLYRTQVTVEKNGTVVESETQLSRVERSHSIRQDPQFIRQLRRLLFYREAMAVTTRGEATVRLRVQDGKLIPISSNELTVSSEKDRCYDACILSDTLHRKWFNEHHRLRDEANQLIGNQDETGRLLWLQEFSTTFEEIIRRYDTKYLWYIQFVGRRLARYL